MNKAESAGRGTERPITLSDGKAPARARGAAARRLPKVASEMQATAQTKAMTTSPTLNGNGITTAITEAMTQRSCSRVSSQPKARPQEHGGNVSLNDQVRRGFGARRTDPDDKRQHDLCPKPADDRCEDRPDNDDGERRDGVYQALAQAATQPWDDDRAEQRTHPARHDQNPVPPGSGVGAAQAEGERKNSTKPTVARATDVAPIRRTSAG